VCGATAHNLRTSSCRLSVDTEFLTDLRFTFRHAVRIPSEGWDSVVSYRFLLIRKVLGSFLDSDDGYSV
jgi:hypothetical protein